MKLKIQKAPSQGKAYGEDNKNVAITLHLV